MQTQIAQIQRKQEGFTLIELLIVITIIALLAIGILLILNSSRVTGRDAKRTEDLKVIQTAFDTFYTRNGKYPVCTALTPKACLDAGPPAATDIIKSALTDPNTTANGGQEYAVTSSASSYTLTIWFEKKDCVATLGGTQGASTQKCTWTP